MDLGGLNLGGLNLGGLNLGGLNLGGLNLGGLNLGGLEDFVLQTVAKIPFACEGDFCVFDLISKDDGMFL